MIDELLSELGEVDHKILQHKNAIKELQLQAKSLEGRRKSIAEKAANEMVEAGCTSSDVDGIRWTVRNTPQSVIVQNESLIPPKYFKEKTTTTLNKTLLKNALKNGATIQGAELSNGGITLQAKGIS